MFRAWVIAIAATLLVAAAPPPTLVKAPQAGQNHTAQSSNMTGSHQTNGNGQNKNSLPTYVLLDPKQIEDEAAKTAKKIYDEAPIDWWERGTALFLAFMALVQTAVFGYQAYKLRQTVRDGEDAIKAATKAATAASRQASIAEATIRNFEMPQIVLDTHQIRVEKRNAKVPNTLSPTGFLEEFYVEFVIRNIGRSAAERLIVRTTLQKEGESVIANQDYNIGSLAAGEPTKPIVVTKAKEWPHVWFNDVWQRTRFLKLKVTFEYVDRLDQTVVVSQLYVYAPKHRRFVIGGLGTKSVSNQFNPQTE